MNHQELLAKFDLLEDRFRQLLAERNVLKEVIRHDKLQIAQLENELLDHHHDVKNFQNQHKISKIVSSMAEGTQSASELKSLLNEYIREIDKCIAHLSE